MWAIRGRVLPMSQSLRVAPSESAVFTGTVWIADDGSVAEITKARARPPVGFEKAAVVDVGANLVLPGLIDLHNHLAYDTLPLWTDPGQRTPFSHHNAWPRTHSYAPSTTWPAYGLITACPRELLAYVETKAVVGGTTSIQGSPPKNKPRDGWLVRNIEDETFGSGDANRIYASVLTAKPEILVKTATRLRNDGVSFIYHCAEGQRGSLVAQEYAAAQAAGCLQRGLIAVHTNAVDKGAYRQWQEPGAIAWSPFSNLWLYGQTTDVVAAREAGLTICLGSDWAPSGTKNVQGELKVAKLVSAALDLGLTDEDLVKMVTSGPGDVLQRPWGRQIGRLQPGARADVVVIRASRNSKPFSRVVASTEDDVQLVVIDGRPVYGTPALMREAKATRTTALQVGERRMALALTTYEDRSRLWEWDSVVARMQQVRANPRHEIEVAQAAYARSSREHPDDPPLRMALDMPTGLAPQGGLPHDLADVVIPPLSTLTHDEEWLASVPGRGFHGGVLDDLTRFYR